MAAEGEQTYQDIRPSVTRKQVRKYLRNRQIRRDTLEIIKKDLGGEIEREIDARERRITDKNPPKE